ncbi:thioredoxin fold domain-containing protein [Balneolaceae bacterium YR4-1]|uniref:Thioredoxin fold domain-containing protein n=1 Tax=Halalkalibaculum roseum TaxID=2709311 RepID=A0A6M1STS1_9BACT|nr:thioredoxin fold domain-containing protein [Halalkalibaculum roseum]NGP75498.1 thioredoxin fold domain-containing protein [Halalkalibaculum roseum]
MKLKYFLFLLPLVALVALGAYNGDEAEEAEGITWYSMKEAQDLAAENNKKVLVYAEAVWCTYCKKMENEVFPKQEVIDSIARYYYPVRVDIESDKKHEFNEETLTGSQFAQKYRVQGTPTFFFIDEGGNILGAQPGYIPPDVFTNLLAFVGSDAHERVSFEEYTEENKN